MHAQSTFFFQGYYLFVATYLNCGTKFPFPDLQVHDGQVREGGGDDVRQRDELGRQHVGHPQPGQQLQVAGGVLVPEVEAVGDAVARVQGQSHLGSFTELLVDFFFMLFLFAVLATLLSLTRNDKRVQESIAKISLTPDVFF